MKDLSNEAYRKWYDEEAVPSIQLLSSISTAGFAEAAWSEAVRRSACNVLEIINAYIDHIASPNECVLLREIKTELLRLFYDREHQGERGTTQSDPGERNADSN